ncbi:D-alanyl-D-alanine carboxypeptidase/D-alanyl-D-alanine-endopeptidase [Hymenobacter sp. DG25B]|uniref:D-alanyl-D-alanine carboxypeptidase/D-alanyl-D-alanine-endopeptidase n=1 Tax=Hymenobacter sp. DG25B TaxID=1385664 RepID=UPI00066282C7|nr:D-alanyl-D-alanine carboxypeptidase [Hymenobacter sp. DG25B]
MHRKLYFLLLLLGFGVAFQAAANDEEEAAELALFGKNGPHWLYKLVAHSPVLRQHHVGLSITDAATGERLFSYRDEEYFVPASTMKLFSLYAGLHLLGDSLPSLRYVVRQDSLIFWGTGDPTLLHGDVPSRAAFQFLQRRPEKLFYAQIPCVEPFGPGWSWDDYNYYYQPERGPFPIYGHTVRFYARAGKAQPLVLPQVFTASIEPAPSGYLNRSDHVRRAVLENKFFVMPIQKNWVDETPFRTSPALLMSLLQDTLHRPILPAPWQARAQEQVHTLAGLPVDSLYRRMIQVSDNFLAEQLLLMCSSRLGPDSLNTARTIRTMKQRYLHDLPDAPVWVDGSGLSRQNLITPRDMTVLLLKLHQEVPEQRLLSLLAAGGGHGTLRRLYHDQRGPWVWGKTGTLSNTHNLAGYLRTKKGRLLAFSFMNNNHVQESSAIRQEMQKVLAQVRERM